MGEYMASLKIICMFEDMKKTRAVFKLALRYCKNHIDQIKADRCAEELYTMAIRGNFGIVFIK